MREDFMCPPSASDEASSGKQGSYAHPAAMERLVGASDIQGAMAFYAFTQHPFCDPPHIASMVSLIRQWAEHDFDCVGDYCTRWFSSGIEIDRWLTGRIEGHLEAKAIVTEWNTPRSQHGAPYVFTSRFGGPKPEDDFIDIGALTRNVARMAWEQAAEFQRPLQHSGLPDAQTPLSRGAAQAVTEGNSNPITEP